MKKHINEIINQVEDWDNEDIERLISELESLTHTKEYKVFGGDYNPISDLDKVLLSIQKQTGVPTI